MNGRWRMMNLGERTCPRTWRLATEHVRNVRLGFIIAGEACWHMNGVDHVVGPGDVVAVLPGTIRSARATTHFRHASVELDWIRHESNGRRVGQLHTESSSDIRELPEWALLPPTLHIGRNEVHALITVLRRANVEIELDEFGKRHMVDAYVRQVLIRLYRYVMADTKKHSPHISAKHEVFEFQRNNTQGESYERSLQTALHYIHMHLNDRLNIAHVADACGYSESHLRRLFRQHIGKTPGEYITDARVQRARRLLTSGRFTVSAIAEEVGFSDPSHFSRVFKSTVGMSPRDYMNQTKSS